MIRVNMGPVEPQHKLASVQSESDLLAEFQEKYQTAYYDPRLVPVVPIKVDVSPHGVVTHQHDKAFIHALSSE